MKWLIVLTILIIWLVALNIPEQPKPKIEPIDALIECVYETKSPAPGCRKGFKGDNL